MTSNITTCDLCPKTTSVEEAYTNGFTKINVQGESSLKLRPLLGKNDHHVDFCQHCFAAFLDWAAQHKASHAPKPTAPEVPPASISEPVPAAHEEVHA